MENYDVEGKKRTTSARAPGKDPLFDSFSKERRVNKRRVKMEVETKERKEKLRETLSMKKSQTMFISDVNNGSVGKSKKRKA